MGKKSNEAMEAGAIMCKGEEKGSVMGPVSNYKMSGGGSGVRLCRWVDHQTS